MITFDPNGGDMGRADKGHMHPMEFHVILPHIANILEMLAVSKLSTLPFKYAFEFDSYYLHDFQLVIRSAKLPSHVAFYECDGKNIFEMRGQSGGVVHGHICYLVTKHD